MLTDFHRIKSLLTVALLWGATGAQALDCNAPDPAQSFNSAAASASEVVIVMGRFAFDDSLLIGDVGEEGVVYPPIPGRFVGDGLTQDGFTTALQIPVDIQQVCAGIWCGHFSNTSGEVIAFLDVTDGQYTLPVTPCGSGIFPADPAMVRLFTACIRGEAC